MNHCSVGPSSAARWLNRPGVPVRQLYAVRIVYEDRFGGSAYLQHKNRSAWSRRRAQQHAADIRAGRTGIRNFVRVEVVED